MKMSDAGRKALVEASEGCSLKAYRDSVGVWTIGYGHTGRMHPPRVTPGETCTMTEADLWLENDLSATEIGISADVHVPLTQHQFDALVDLAFNIGLGAFKSSTVLREINTKNYNGAAAALLLWNRAGGKVLQGLVHRRLLEHNWFLETGIVRQMALFTELPDMVHAVDHPDGPVAKLVNRTVLAFKTLKRRIE
jgi:lysozyme